MPFDPHMLPLVPVHDLGKLGQCEEFIYQGALYWNQRMQCIMRLPPDQVPTDQVEIWFNRGREAGFQQSQAAFEGERYQHHIAVQGLNSKITELDAMLRKSWERADNVKRHFGRIDLQNRTRESAQKNAAEQRMRALENNLASLTRDLAQKVSETNSAYIAERAAYTAEQAAWAAEKESLLAQIGVYKREQTDLESVNRELNRVNVQQTEEIKTLRRQMVEMRKSFGINSKAVTESQQHWTQQNANLHEQIRVLTEQIRASDAAFEAFRAHTVEKIQSIREDFNRVVESMDQKYQVVKKGHRDATNEIQTIKERSKTAQNNFSRQMDSMRDTLNTAQKDLEDTKAKKDEVLAQNANMEGLLQKVMDNADKHLMERYAEANVKIQCLIGYIDELKDQNVALTKKMAKRSQCNSTNAPSQCNRN